MVVDHAGRKKGGDGNPVLGGVAIREDDDAVACLDSGGSLLADVVEGLI